MAKYTEASGFKASDFQEADISHVSYDNQVIFFNVIKEEVASLNLQEDILPADVFMQQYAQKILDIIDMAVSSVVPAQDYLCYMYKKGIPGVLKKNLVRAHEWGLIAASNGSKLSIERLRLFFEPVYNYVLNSDRLDDIISKNELTQDNIAEFIAQNFSILFCQMANIDLLTTAKKDLEGDDNFVRFNHDAEAVKKKVLPRLIELIS